MEITYTKVHLKEPKNDFKYWQTQPYEARVIVLEQISQEYHQWNYDAQPRFQKVLNFI